MSYGGHDSAFLRGGYPKGAQMATDKALKDWEKEICDIVDKIAENPNDKFELAEEIIDICEDLILTAYVKGRGGVKGLRK